MSTQQQAVKTSRREELLAIAAELFAQRGFRNTTVRDIADAAGILSGSLYHHFDSKESMVDEILDSFQTELFRKYEEVVSSDLGVRAKFEAIIRISFEAIHDNHSEVAIYQNDAAYLVEFDRFGYLNERNLRMRRIWVGLLEEGVRSGTFRPDLDAEVVYRFIRDTVWVAVRWYRPDGDLSAHDVAEQYLSILLDGIAARRRPIKKSG
ncbi:TetR/AcrR family transcriptional regulator [Haloactinomyces albus]|uniref:AcrR family transcriptional regulator n=1 Tax=Haloactinomyces albus TaxID=1352928 RepID=A0AAE3ZH58_9ACTN|nr:TetR/AcrR family transcriptional regulator [Haloactinomyces albus]MDR7303826.1 AcrR family transcriptional regulator [Haloactinomyces albus]